MHSISLDQMHYYLLVGKARLTSNVKILIHLLICLIFVCALPTLSMAQSSSEYKIVGEVVDSENGNPVLFVQVALFEPANEDPAVLVTSDEQGRFELSAPRGNYNLRLFYVGYEDKEIESIELTDNLNLGKIEMVSESEMLDEVVIEARQDIMTTTVEGITINPDQNLSNMGGTLLDILRNTPSVRVSDDGSISLRGSTGTNVLINGRNSSLTRNLDRIPASAIKQIKIINNPNARYDAEAEAGVIDIILKKGGSLGTHGGVDALYGTRNRMNAGAQISHRTLNYNIYGGYNIRRWERIGTRTTQRTIFADNEFLNQENNYTNTDLGHNFNVGADYYFGENIISYQGVLNTSRDDQVNNLYSELTDSQTDALLLNYLRQNNENETDDGFDNAIIYERTFEDDDRSFKFSANQSYTNQYKTQNIDIYRNSSVATPELLDDRERAIIDEKRYQYVLQADYTHPITEQIKMETGLKSNIRDFTYDYDYSRRDNQTGEFEEIPTISNEFDYSDRIHAGYILFSRSSEKLDVIAGVRGEYTTFTTFLYNTGEQNDQQYFNLFPSLQALYKLNDEHSAKFTYSRRIERPTAWRLNPFPDITDSLSVRRGNPDLQPEMIHSIELGHIYETEDWGLTTNLFYRHVDGQLDYIALIEDGVTYSQPANLNTAQSYGIEIIGMADITEWWRLSGSITGFGIQVDGSNLGENFRNEGFAYNSKLTSDFELPLGLNLQLVFNYESPEIEAQGRDLEQYHLDASMQKNLFKDKLNLSVSLRDVFDTRRFAGFNNTESFEQEFYSKRETRILLVSARYSF